MRSEAAPRKRLHPPRISSVALTAWLAAGLLLTLSAPVLAVSGLSSNGPAVQAQYPDARELTPEGAPPAPPTLGELIVRSRKRRHGASPTPVPPRIEQRVQAALPTRRGLGVSESGSIPLLIGGIAVLSIGAILRWRRGGPSGDQAADVEVDPS